MGSPIINLYSQPPIDKNEVFRYAMCNGTDKTINQLLDECIREAALAFNFRVSYKILPCSTSDDIIDLTFEKTHSKGLAKALAGCEHYIVFAATVGVAVDRLIKKYSRTAPSKALLFQALGTERIECLCDLFSKEIAKELNIKVKKRVSPGYGDIPLELQPKIFEVLECPIRLGLVLNDSLLMTPTKSVTAFIGVKK